MRDDLLDGVVTLLLTDIEGSTRLLHNLGAEGYARAQAEHREVLRETFRSHRGVEIDTQGDAFFYVFPSALDGLRGAVAAQRGLESFAFTHGSPVKVRMGMHTGEPQRTEEGYVGVPVNTAARIAGVGHGGQVLLSATTAELLMDDLQNDEITLRDLGKHRLKDLDTPQRLLQIVIPELAADFPPPRTAETRPNNLPVPLTPFVGRARLVIQIRDLLLQPMCRAATLLGPGGTGKTRLAIRVATELLHSMKDGAFFVSLAPIHDPALVVPEIAKVLGVKEEMGRECAKVKAEIEFGIGGISSTPGGDYKMDGSGDGTAGGDFVFGNDATDQFFRLFGDSDADGDVDGQDSGRFGLTFQRASSDPAFNPAFDFDRDGDVDGQDYGRFVQRVHKRIGD